MMCPNKAETAGAGNSSGAAADRDDLTASHSNLTPRDLAVSIDYRADPADLTTAQLAGEVLWLDDAPTWPGAIGDHARSRRDALRTELCQRERGRR